MTDRHVDDDRIPVLSYEEALEKHARRIYAQCGPQYTGTVSTEGVTTGPDLLTWETECDMRRDWCRKKAREVFADRFVAGVELDRQVALQVMGWPQFRSWDGPFPCWEEWTDRSAGHISVHRSKTHADPFSPSTNLTHAWEVFERMGGDDVGVQWRADPRGFWRAWIGEGQAEAETAPLAICRAALKAMA